ncbi:hypothetical protein BS50DRAFT_580241 [Corynespora cassiicola Philippines]|uniref:GPI anchored serine-threonine rich protein n=1 Tax=Corynespora cassiicola Philippines TaxID=1448308 RepID=A0A2T2N1D9_CORCC|nr:hypothetical protein BS50DRAFT_580241 [Corynespora cassiicola Philippines]
MRSAIIISFLSIALPVVHASPNLNPFQRRDTCSGDYREACDRTYCMTAGAVCCGIGDGRFCDEGQYCLSGGCCDKGEICTGSAPPPETITFQVGSEESTPAPTPTELSGSITAHASGTTTARNTAGSATGSGSFPQSTGAASGLRCAVGLHGLALVVGQLLLGL